MMKSKSNKDIRIIKDDKKSYVYIHEGGKLIGILMWNYRLERCVFDEGKKL